MGLNKVVIGGLLVALALVGLAAAEELKCENPSGKQDCKKDLKKDQYLYVKCPDSATFVPQDAFTSTTAQVCKKALAEFNDNCSSDAESLKTLVPGVEITYPDGDSKKNNFKIVNKQELKSDMSVYATCKNTDSDGFIIAIKFLKGGSSDASTRATVPAVLLGALTTLAVMLRA